METSSEDYQVVRSLTLAINPQNDNFLISGTCRWG